MKWQQDRLAGLIMFSFLTGRDRAFVACESVSVWSFITQSSHQPAMSLPVSSELCSLERVARYRSACINGSPYAINKPIDIKGRRRW
ncbi:hypothetical protein PDJAM_G00239290 [Pangasius djambal]|uniref:Uncharacterized protein n=1 Tax=Pangasius djambal TaxID=1691987 RepID=A0ACC5YGU4_9TELE|nr:hypothetical protein [Pangasius djambal]